MNDRIRTAIESLEAETDPGADTDLCAWNEDTRLFLAEDFIRDLGLTDLYAKFLSIRAAEELAEGEDGLGDGDAEEDDEEDDDEEED